MVGDMERFKINASIDDASEIIDILVFIGCGLLATKEQLINEIGRGCTKICESGNGIFTSKTEYNSLKEITLQHLRDLVVLKRNDRKDATNYRSDGKEYFHAKSTDYFYHFQDDAWVLSTWMNYQLLPQLKPIERKEIKEYLDTNYELRSVKQTSGVPSGWVEIPEGAEIAIELSGRPYFMKLNGETFDEFYDSVWQTGTITKRSISKYRKILWQRNLATPNTAIQEKLKFIEKWLNGEKIQYILGVESEKTQADKSKVDKSKWCNFTDGAMQYIKRSDIKFREAPKYVTINGIEFKSVESLLKHVKNNFDLDDEK